METINHVRLNTKDLKNINLNHDDNLDEYDLETINHVRPMAWHNRFKQWKACKQGINACSMASNKIVGWCFRRWEKRNRTILMNEK